jgi:predicted ABC-type exoprotein transport system permease subunit
MSIIDTFNANDYLFIFIGAFVITVIVGVIISLPKNGWDMIIYMVEVYIVTLLIGGAVYGYIKSKSKELTFLTQERIYIFFFLVLTLLIMFIVTREIIAIKHTPHGFILVILSVTFVLVCLFMKAANSAITERYALNQPSMQNIQNASRYIR